MKANKIFAAAMAALALVGFSACEKKTGDKLELTENSVSMKVGETHQLVANVTVEAWTTSAEEVATVDNKGLVTAVKEGTAIISATANGETKTCVVKVGSDSGNGGDKTVKGSQIWPVLLDENVTEANQAKVVANFGPDEQNKFLYVWDGTYLANDNPTGRGFYGADSYFAMTVGGSGWSGCGFCLKSPGTEWQAAEALRAAIVASPDDYYLHIAIKATDNYSHCFYVFGSEATKFVLGNKPVYDGPIYKDFTRDGGWQEFDIPMATYAAALSTVKFEDGGNVFVILSEGVLGAQLNLDAVYFYKK